MPSLVTRFHLLIFAVTLAITAVAILRVPPEYAFPAHWRGSGADWLWPRDLALAVAPVLQAVVMGAFFLLGRALTKNHMAKTRHIFDPALSFLLAVPAACQLALLFVGIGSDLDVFRGTGFLFGAALALLGLVLFYAERHSYGGLRMPWPIVSNRAWSLVHRVTGALTHITGLAILALTWFDPGPGLLVIAFAASLFGLPLFAALATVVLRRL